MIFTIRFRRLLVATLISISGIGGVSPVYSEGNDPNFSRIAVALQRHPERPLVLVHGISAGGDNWDHITDALRTKVTCTHIRVVSGVPIYKKPASGAPTIWMVNYYSGNIIYDTYASSVPLFAERLSIMIAAILRETRSTQVTLVCHSMGGIVARETMILRPTNWDYVHALLMIGTPIAGVPVSLPFGQYADLWAGSRMIKNQTRNWETAFAKKPIWLGVVGGVQHGLFRSAIDGSTTDNGGPWYTQIQHAIPYGEWRDAVASVGTPTTHTAHFQYRLAVEAEHNALLTHPETIAAIVAAISAP